MRSVAALVCLWMGSGAFAANLDFSNWKLEVAPEQSLAGAWHFYPDSFVEPSVLAQHQANRVEAELPNFFGEPTSGMTANTGFGTYVARVKLPAFAQSKAMVLRIFPADTAGRFFVTDIAGNYLSPIVEQGRVGRDLETTTPQRVPSSVPLQLGLPDEILVWLQVANFHQHIGGLWGAPVLAEATSAFRDERVRSMIDGLSFGLMLLFAVYHLVLYAQGRRETILLSFALLCVLVGVRSAVMARYPESFISDWDDADYAFWLKVEFMTMPLSVMAFAFYFRSFSNYFLRSKLLWQGTVALGLLLVFLIVITPTTFATSILWALQAHMLFGVAWILWYLLGAWKAGENYIDIVLVGGVILGLTVVQDLFHAMGVIESAHYAHYVFGLFLFLQSFLIAQRYSETMDERDDLTHRVLKQATMLAHESDKRAKAEGAQRDAERALRIQAEAKMTLFGEAVHHINNPLNHILGSLHGIAARQSEVRKLTSGLFDEDESLSPEALAVKNQYEGHFDDALEFYTSATSAVERAASTVQLLRALSGVDGISYRTIYFGDIWELVESRSPMVAQLIARSSLNEILDKRCLGHPAMYAQALELLVGALDLRGNEHGVIQCVNTQEQVTFKMRRAGDEGLQETAGQAMRLTLGFNPAASMKAPERVVEIVLHLLEPYGSTIDLSDEGFSITILTNICGAE